MRCPHYSRSRRAAFTLIELLVVIAIIMVLMSLLMGAIFKVKQRALELQNRHEIGLLDTALTSLVSEYNLKYVPSVLDLSGNDPASNAFMASMFPKLAANPNWPKSLGGLKWGGSGKLYGQHVLVFLLGGVPVKGGTNPKTGQPTYSCSGFSTNPSDPTSTTAPNERKAPLFDFIATRLAVDTNGFLVYRDTFGKTPYAFFSSGNDSYLSANCANISSKSLASGGSGTPQPYWQTSSPTTYLKSTSWQIISAGTDGKFGAGGMLWPAIMGKTADGYDDQSNFTSNLLGKGQN